MVLHRLRQEGNDGLVAGMAFVDAMWRDIEPRLKIAGAQMSQKTDGLYYLNNHFNSAVVAYDEALLVNDDKAMAHALWLNVFDGRDCDPRNLELLLAYTRKQTSKERVPYTKAQKEHVHHRLKTLTLPS
uniref:Ubiquinol-cytochrome c reductase complex chaperone CBP3-like protein n=1 Tax=Magallana gigas TaxID=29159 RepID=K1Q7B7_MAGGI